MASMERLHFLDWLRALMVWFVVYAHLNFCGLAYIPDITIDDHAWSEHPSTLAVRWNSIARQWCIPLLFWISGAASAISFNGHVHRFLKGLGKLLLLTLVGVASNGAMWLLGPRDPNCSIRQPCPGKGIVFDFTEDPFEGNVEPFFNQMWFTLALILVMLVNWPFCKVLCGQASLAHLLITWIIMSVFYVILAMLAGPECEQPAVLLVWLTLLEAAFMTVSGLTVSRTYPAWIPARLLHYVCAGIGILQLGVPAFEASVTDDITASYALFLAVGCTRWFQLGFLMTRPRKSLNVDIDVKPLTSQAWPLVILLAVLFAPSTNFVMAGILTYPYYLSALDRSLYVAGTFTMFFVVDRTSRCVPCIALPRVIGLASLVLFVFQITFLTVFMHFGLESIGALWMLSSITAVALVSICSVISSTCSASARLIRRGGRPPQDRLSELNHVQD